MRQRDLDLERVRRELEQSRAEVRGLSSSGSLSPLHFFCTHLFGTGWWWCWVPQTQLSLLLSCVPSHLPRSIPSLTCRRSCCLPQHCRRFLGKRGHAAAPPRELYALLWCVGLADGRVNSSLTGAALSAVQAAGFLWGFMSVMIPYFDGTLNCVSAAAIVDGSRSLSKCAAGHQFFRFG